MDENFRKLVIETLERGENLPPEWARELFPPERKEYELVYHGKEREEDIVVDTMAVPFQPFSSFGNISENEWHNKLIFGDNLQALKTLVEKKQAGELSNSDGTSGVRLIYIDPPFATKKEFSGSKDQKAYRDRIVGTEFLEFLRKRLILLRELLSDDGSVYIHLDWKKSHYVKVLLDEIFGDNHFQNEIVWHYSGWNRHLKSNFNRRWESIFYYSKKSTPLYNSYAQPWESKEAYIKARKQELHLDDENKEYVLSDAGGGKRVKRFIEEAIAMGRPIDDVWELDKLNNSSKEITGYPTQKPEDLLERIITASSKAGDIVLDAFAGSGTTIAVAEKLKRNWIGIDCGKFSIYTIQKRMLNLKSEIGNKGSSLTPRPFKVYSAGLYDFKELKQLPWEDWRFFALQLFGCKHDPHEIGGLKLDGRLRGFSVLVFDHVTHSGEWIDEETISDIHRTVGTRLGSKFFIIAPRNVFDFQQDYIDLDGVRYYALRIPYSVINELHSRNFTAIKQPNDEKDVNATVDAVGFDFIQPPAVSWKVGIREGKGGLFNEAYLSIQSFESKARIRGTERLGGLETFAMLMLDFNYNKDVFDFDRAFYADQLKKEDWIASFAIEDVGQSVMAIFIDIYGNEARELITVEHFDKQGGTTKLESSAA